MEKRFLLWSLLVLLTIQCSYGKPNVVIIMADDMGSNDASYKGSNQILTPNIDALAYHGVILNRFYSPSLCTPSRSSVMTGKYPHTIGMQNYVIKPCEPYGLGLDQKLISNYFQEAGYKTHLVGKWHLGFFQEAYLPTNRGFDSFYGYYNGLIDYYNYTYLQTPYVPGYDFRINTAINYMEPGTYATDLFTNEAKKIISTHNTAKPLFMMVNHLAPHTGNSYALMQAPASEIAKHANISDPDRRVYAAMVTKLDQSIGDIVEALDQKGILNNTIIVFYSDNGAHSAGPFNNTGSNYPLRGQKYSPWEGGSRNLAFVFSPLINEPQRVHNGYFHNSDILPTLAGAAGIPLGPVDGFNQWSVLVNNTVPSRQEVVTQLDNVYGYTGLIVGQYKLVNGTTEHGNYDKHFGQQPNVLKNPQDYVAAVLGSKVGNCLKGFCLTGEKILQLRAGTQIDCKVNKNPLTSCSPNESPCLFNIVEDPCERQNLACTNPAELQNLKNKLDFYLYRAVPARRIPIGDPRCDPGLHNNTWVHFGM